MVLNECIVLELLKVDGQFVWRVTKGECRNGDEGLWYRTTYEYINKPGIATFGMEEWSDHQAIKPRMLGQLADLIFSITCCRHIDRVALHLSNLWTTYVLMLVLVVINQASIMPYLLRS